MVVVLRSLKHEVQVRCKRPYNVMAQLVAATNIYYTILRFKRYCYARLVKNIGMNFCVLVEATLFLLLVWSAAIIRSVCIKVPKTSFQLLGCIYNKTIIAFSLRMIPRNIKTFVLSFLVDKTNLDLDSLNIVLNPNWGVKSQSHWL